MSLTADNFLNDPRLAQARALFASALADYQKNLTAPRPADPARQISYDQLIQHFNEARGGNLYFPYLGSGIGNGPFVELADGSVKFDLIAGIGVHHFGHGHTRLAQAALDAALRDTIMQGNLQQNIESTQVAADLLNRAAPHSHLAHCFLTTSGAMANENALKLAFHKRPGTTRILAFEHTFAGRTLALSAITDKATYRHGFPPVLAVDYLPFFDEADPAGSTARALATLRQHLQRFPNQHAALWAELVLGEGGFYPGTTDFFTTLFTEARAKNILIVADEVQTFGRTSQLFAFQHFQLEPLVDIVTIGKLLQLCATLFTDSLKPAPGIISQTFTASTSAIFAAHAILADLLTPDLFGPNGRNLQVHQQFTDLFQKIHRDHPTWIRGPHGIGGMIAFAPFDASEATAKKLLHALFHNGLIAFYNGGGGGTPIRIRLLPPIPILTNNHITTIAQILEKTLEEMSHLTT